MVKQLQELPVASAPACEWEQTQHRFHTTDRAAVSPAGTVKGSLFTRHMVRPQLLDSPGDGTPVLENAAIPSRSAAEHRGQGRDLGLAGI